MSSHFVYIVRCKDGSLYTGWTIDVPKRVVQHNTRKGAKYTRPRLPVQLVYSRRCSSKKAAMRQELRVKQLSRAQKINLITTAVDN